MSSDRLLDDDDDDIPVHIRMPIHIHIHRFESYRKIPKCYVICYLILVDSHSNHKQTAIISCVHNSYSAAREYAIDRFRPNVVFANYIGYIRTERDSVC